MADRHGSGREGGSSRDATAPAAAARVERPAGGVRERASTAGATTDVTEGAPTETVDVPSKFRSLELGLRVRHYELIRPLGRGGMGQVFLGRDTRLGRLVALKFMTRHSGRRVRRFLDEARVTARCSHENIVVIHEVDVHQDYPYMVLEYLSGKSLRAWLEQRGRRVERWSGRPGSPESLATVGLPPGRAVELMIPVVRALVCAHEHGIVHRDLKPENVMITDAGAIKVLDFGIAKLLDDNQERRAPTGLDTGGEGDSETITAAGDVIGTRRYMAPEQWRAEEVDHRADIWAAGVILHELVTGVHPLAPVTRARLDTIESLDVPIPRVRERRPDLGSLAAVIDRCLIKRKDDRLESARALLAALEEVAAPARGHARAEDVSPYAGLAAFQESDADRFHGRTRAVSMVIDRVVEEPLTTLVGPSGAGKSSLVRAGVIPALGRTGDVWEALVIRPGPRPVSALASLLAQHAWEASTTKAAGTGEPDAAAPAADELTRDALAERLRAEPGYLGVHLRARSDRRRCRILLFVDQLEEVYTLAPEPARAAFLGCLAGVADDPGSPLRVILAMRSDFLDRAGDAQDALPGFHRSLILLPPMARDGLREALTRPLASADHRFEDPAVIDDILAALEHTAGALPLLQFTATKLWERRDVSRRLLTSDSYRAIGGVAGTLANHADEVLGAMPAADRALARAIFLRLVTPERTRAIVHTGELREMSARPAEIDRVLARLVDARLLVIEGGGELRDQATVEIVHESLIERWPMLADWIHESRDDMAFLARLRHAAREWQAAGESDDLLWRGQVGEHARRWRARYEGELGQAESDFLAATFALAERAQRQRRRLVVAAFVTLTAVAALLSVLVWREREATLRAAREAERARSQAARAQIETDRAQREASRARDAIRMALARELEDDPTTVLALLREVESRDRARGWEVLASTAMRAGVARAVLVAHTDQISAVAYSPDGSRVASSSWDGTARVWNADGSGRPVVLRGHGGRVSWLAFSPDGKRVVTASADRTARVWRADGAGAPVILAGHEGGLTMAAFSPDGERVVTASDDGTARVWRADGAGAPVILRGHTGRIRRVGFSPDGERVVTASLDGTARVWRADGAGAPIVYSGHTDQVLAASFSPDGERVITASADGTARVWSADGTGRPVILAGHTGWVIDAAFDPAGRRIVTASLDNTARIWNAGGSVRPHVLAGHVGMLYTARFSPDGTRVVTASVDKTARVWNADGSGTAIVLTGHRSLIRTVVFSPDGARIATGAEDGTVRIWDATSAPLPEVLAGHDGAVVSVAFSPDGARIATASADRTARVWRMDRSSPPVTLGGHVGAVSSVAFDPSGTRVVTGSFDRSARVWRIDRPAAPVAVLRGHTGWVSSVDVDPHGRRVATGSQDRTVRVWSVDGTGAPVILRGHTGEVLSVSFSPDGARVLSAAADGTARVWRADGSGEELVELAHPAAVYIAAFSPDGALVATACEDGIARIWDADGTGPPVLLEGHSDSLTHVSFSPDGARVVTSSRDKTARIWRIDGAGPPIVLRGHGNWVDAAVFSPDGARIATASEDETVRLWTDLDPIELHERALWRATSYCMPVTLRRALLRVDDDTARANHLRCHMRVAGAEGQGGR